jgi:hypothetical protein
VAITAPNGGEVLTGASTNVTWTETVGAGRTVANRSLEYSLDGGASWTTIATGVGPSPYAWNLSAVPNSGAARVRIRITDDGAPSFGATDGSNANFTLDRATGDGQGPVVVAGSIATTPNPLVRPNAGTLEARISDQLTGAGNVTQAEWSIGPTPAAAGSGTPMTGAFGTMAVDVSISIDTNPIAPGPQKLWVRGRDADGNWGPASSFDVQVNGPPLTGVNGTIPKVAFLSQNAPNPFATGTHISFGLPKRSPVQLGIYDLQGRLVKRLVNGPVEAGQYRVEWDRRGERGERANAGVYYCRFVAGSARFDKRMVVLD